jgi:hypothetical protein
VIGSTTAAVLLIVLTVSYFLGAKSKVVDAGTLDAPPIHSIDIEKMAA